jgi:hypothetical protein
VSIFGAERTAFVLKENFVMLKAVTFNLVRKALARPKGQNVSLNKNSDSY